MCIDSLLLFSGILNEQKHSRKKPVKIIAALLFVIVVLGLIFVLKFLSNKEKSDQKQSSNQQQNQITAVAAFVVKGEILDNEIKAIGNIRANEEAEIRSEISRLNQGNIFP